RPLHHPRHQRLVLPAVATPDGAAHRRLPGPRGPAPGAAHALLPVPRPRRLGPLPGRPRVQEARRQDAAAGVLRTLEPAALPPPVTVARRLQFLPGQQGPLPAHSRRVRPVRRLAPPPPVAGALTSCGNGSPPDGDPGGLGASPPHTAAPEPQTLEPSPSDSQ